MLRMQRTQYSPTNYRMIIIVQKLDLNEKLFVTIEETSTNAIHP